MANDSPLQYPSETWTEIQYQQKQRVWTAETADTSERKRLLSNLRQMLTDHEQEWLEALHQDLGKSSVEAFTSEIAVVLNEIDFMEKQLDKWQRPQSTYQIKLSAITRIRTEKRAYGSVLIISPWNYPLQLALLPLVGAIAAGNSCFIKPSEHAPATGKMLARLIEEYFPVEVITVVKGDAEVAQELLKLSWDFIFFTGSKKVGSLVHQAAAKKQTPAALELGGKNPCIVDETNVTKQMVQRIVWGKFLNTGQTCIAPDTVYVQESVCEKFLELLNLVIEEFYGTTPRESTSYGRLIHDKHLDKMILFLNEGTIRYGGQYDTESLFMAPTVMTNIPETSALLSEEIFGPILPVVPYTDLTTLVSRLQQMDSPLAVYLFSQKQETVQFVEKNLQSGSFSVNQVILQAVAANKPFGGIGASGFGRYHGLASLDLFSHSKTLLKLIIPFNASKKYPPYKSNELPLLRKWRKWLF